MILKCVPFRVHIAPSHHRTPHPRHGVLRFVISSSLARRRLRSDESRLQTEDARVCCAWAREEIITVICRRSFFLFLSVLIRLLCSLPFPPHLHGVCWTPIANCTCKSTLLIITHAPLTWFIGLSILFIYSYVVNILLVCLSKIVISFSELQFGLGWGNALSADVGAFFRNLSFPTAYTQCIMYKSMVQYLKPSFFLWYNILCSTIYPMVNYI